ncbi:uncharacterized protein [Aegilops tauschii subsp. strangulata]|uniref:uncharacterized protein n=1 Tax=Aegilops tauschii subsp. strangulata TaxID=200361 RepID=UPI003CC88A93
MHHHHQLDQWLAGGMGGVLRPTKSTPCSPIKPAAASMRRAHSDSFHAAAASMRRRPDPVQHVPWRRMTHPLWFIRFFAWIHITHPHRTSCPLSDSQIHHANVAMGLDLHGRWPDQAELPFLCPAGQGQGQAARSSHHQATVDWSPPSSGPWSSCVKGTKKQQQLKVCLVSMSD